MDDTGMRQPKYFKKHLPHCHFFHHQPRMEWPGIEPVPPS